MNKSVLTEIAVAAREAPGMYFAPLIGAVKGIQVQYRRMSQRRTEVGRTLGRADKDKPIV